jgi:hypothetical protein
MKLKLVVILILLGFFLYPQFLQAADLINTYPRLANYFLKWEISEQEARELAKWDFLVLDMEVQENSPGALRLIRELNPDIIILAYITSQEIIDNINQAAGNTGAFLRRKLRLAISDNWWLRDTSGRKICNWPGTYMLNLTNFSGKNENNQKFKDFLPEFVADNIASSGFFDGVFYDNTWGDISWINGGDIDVDNDGHRDDSISADNLWTQGFREMLQKTRNLLGDEFIIVGNGRVFWGYQDLLNGMMLESFPSYWENGGHWSGSMETYLKLPVANIYPQLSIINVNKKNQIDYKSMRFGLASALLGEGFYSFDYDTSNHSQTWWYDEYGVNLGPAQNSAYNLLTENNNIQPGLWRRDFKFGSVLLNSTDKNQLYVFSKENFEKITSLQDKEVNSGEKINFVNLPSQDGLVILKTSDSILNSTFINGYFYRVFNDKGNQVRNGFFSFSSVFPTGSSVVIADGGYQETEEINIVADRGKLSLDKNGSEIVSFFPYNNLFRNKLNIDTKINNGFFEIVAIGPTVGGGPQVRVFSADGRLLSSFFAYDKNMRGGVSVALGDVDADGSLDLITGAGFNDKPLVKVFSLSGELKYSFLAYDENFKGGVEVAVGDLSGNGQMEIVVAPGPGGGPQVRIFSGNGQILGQFFAYDKIFRDGLKITLSDLNQDGRQEILVGIKNFF